MLTPFRSITKLTWLLAIFIVVSASFMRQLLNVTIIFVPKSLITIGIWSLLLIIPIVFLFLLCKKSKNSRGILIPTVCALSAVSLAMTMNLPEERVHIIKFGLLGFLSAKDFKNANHFVLKHSAIFCFLVGAVDELFQSILPYRVGDIRDVLFDTVSGILGAIFYISSRKD